MFEGIINMHQQTGGQFLRSHNFFYYILHAEEFNSGLLLRGNNNTQKPASEDTDSLESRSGEKTLLPWRSLSL